MGRRINEPFHGIDRFAQLLSRRVPDADSAPVISCGYIEHRRVDMDPALAQPIRMFHDNPPVAGNLRHNRQMTPAPFFASDHKDGTFPRPDSLHKIAIRFAPPRPRVTKNTDAALRAGIGHALQGFWRCNDTRVEPSHEITMGIARLTALGARARHAEKSGQKHQDTHDNVCRLPSQDYSTSPI